MERREKGGREWEKEGGNGGRERIFYGCGKVFYPLILALSQYLQD